MTAESGRDEFGVRRRVCRSVDTEDVAKRLDAKLQHRAAEAHAGRARVLVNAEAKFAVLAAGVPPERLTKTLRLLDLDGIQVEDGRIDTASVRRAVETLKTEIPDLFAAHGPARSSGGFTVASEGKRSFTAAEVKAMSAVEYSEKRDEIMAAMREGRYREQRQARRCRSR